MLEMPRGHPTCSLPSLAGPRNRTRPTPLEYSARTSSNDRRIVRLLCKTAKRSLCQNLMNGCQRLKIHATNQETFINDKAFDINSLARDFPELVNRKKRVAQVVENTKEENDVEGA